MADLAIEDDGSVHRRWCFTENNWTPQDLAMWRSYEERTTCLMVASEVAPNGTPHLQGYFSLKKPQRLAGLKKNFPRAHFEVALADETCQRAYLFLQKPEGHGDIGEPLIDYKKKAQGERNDITEATVTLKKHGLKRTAEDHPHAFVKFHRGLSAWHSALYEHRPNARPYVVWLRGPPGAGKSRYAYDLHPAADIYRVPRRATTQHVWWFPQYAQQRVCVLDDIRPSSVALTELLDVTDRYPYSVRVSGETYCPFNSPVIYITSVDGPEQYTYDAEPLKQLRRRLSYIVTFSDEDEPQAVAIDPDTGEETGEPFPLPLPQPAPSAP